ncbi:MAG: cold shock domain-containing protein [Colwellia sp.]|nr:cold shock domain-containing protein [Colwellia sp.]
MHKGQLKSWKDDKGFGFIQSSELKQDTFIHISTLKGMSRKPKVGDFIYFEVEKLANGKSRAINCRIEGVAAKATQRHKPRVHKNTSAPKSKIVLILLVIAIGVFGYQRLGLSPSTSPAQQPSNTATPSSSLSNSASSNSNSQYSCDGREHCSQMTSRAEAGYFIKYCPNTKMDGDRDGIPCENDSRF